MTHRPSDLPSDDRGGAGPRAHAGDGGAPTDAGESHESYPDRSPEREAEARAFAVEAARLLSDDKCSDVVLLDVREISQVTDFIVLATGTSDRQMRSALEDVQSLGGERGFPAFRSSVDDRAVWVLADFVDVVVHIFEPNARAHYDLEMLWGDADRLAWSRDGAPAPGRNFAGASPEDFDDPGE